MAAKRKRVEVPALVQLRVRRFSYSLLAFEYQNYFTKHVLPEGIDMDFIIPDTTDFVKGVGEYLNLVKSQQMPAINPICQQLSSALKHTEEAFISYLRWRCERITYDHRYKFMCMCALVSQFVLQYFEKNCFRFSVAAVDALYEIICDNNLIVSEFGSPVIFLGFIEFCVRTEDDKGILDKPRIVSDQFLDFVNKHRDPPKELLKDGANLDRTNFKTLADSSVSEDVKFLDTPESTSDESSGESSVVAGPSSAGTSKSKVPSEVSLAAATAKSLLVSFADTVNVGASTSAKSSVSIADTSSPEYSARAESLAASVADTENVQPSTSESKMEVDSEEAAVGAVCSLCNTDCREFLKKFVEEFKAGYT